MVLSPEFPSRAWMGVVVYLIIADIALLYNIDKLNKMFKFVLIDILIIGGILYVNDYMLLAKDIYELNTTWKYRITTIEDGKQNGEKYFEFYYYSSDNPKSPANGLTDISKEYKGFPSLAVAKYYGVEGIKYIQENEN
jgi:hypothetical protein